MECLDLWTEMKEELTIFGKLICKFFTRGACLKGEHYEFAHDWKAPSNNVCSFYPKGVCVYGSRCRYEHVKVSRSSVRTSSHDTLFSVESPFGTAMSCAGVNTYVSAELFLQHVGEYPVY